MNLSGRLCCRLTLFSRRLQSNSHIDSDGSSIHPASRFPARTSDISARQDKVKHGKEKANPIIPGTSGPNMKVFHEKPVSGAYPAIDTNLAWNNLENDIPAADLEDL